MKIRTTVARGYLLAEFPTGMEECPILVQGPHNSEDGGDDRVEVFTRDDAGHWYRTYVERNANGSPHVNTEHVSSRPDESDEW